MNTSANGIIKTLKAAGLAPTFEQTGGGCGTIMVPTASGKHNVMIGPFSYYEPSETEHADTLSIGIESADPDKWGDGKLGGMFSTETELLFKVEGLVHSPDPMLLEAEDLDAAYLATFGIPEAPRCMNPACDSIHSVDGCPKRF